MKKRRCGSLLAVCALLICLIGLFAASAHTQESILAFSLIPDAISLHPGDSTTLRLSVKNNSIHEADEVAVSLVDREIGFSLRSAPPILKHVPPFSEGTFDLTITVLEEPAAGGYTLTLAAVYTYCIGDVCFQIVDNIPLTITIAAAIQPPPPFSPSVKRSVWRWLPPGLALLLILVGILLWRFARVTVPLYAVLFLLIGGGLAYGVLLNQHEQAQGIAAVLCTSCVGIEEARHEPPTLTAGARAALDRLASDIELLVFYAPWCHSCPYAEALVLLMADYTERLTVRFVNVEEEPLLARAHGVIRSGRTGVPAILRADAGEVIFGIEKLEARLLTLLGVGR